MNWAIYVWLGLQLFGLGIGLAEHGKIYKYNFFARLLASIISIGLLWAGGAFNNL